jgi:predicted transposase YdaD
VTAVPDDEILRHKRIALLELAGNTSGSATDEQLEPLLNYLLQTGGTAGPKGFTERLI